MAKHDVKVTDSFVRTVFRRVMMLKYKRVKHIAFTSNSERSLVLR